MRNTAIAHRDPDALAQFRAIQDLDVMGVIDVAGDFYIEVRRFVSVLTKIMGHNDLNSFLRQWTPKAPRHEVSSPLPTNGGPPDFQQTET